MSSRNDADSAASAIAATAVLIATEEIGATATMSASICRTAIVFPR
jgi:hypothetical protein